MAILVALPLLAAPIALAAVEPGIYFDPVRAVVGDQVRLGSAADYPVCWAPDRDAKLEDWPVLLAPADVALTDANRVAVAGRWTEDDGAFLFDFAVPQVPPGSYRGYVACDADRVDPSSNLLVVELAVPATDAGAGPVEPAVWPAIAAGIAAFLVVLARFARPGPRLRH
ncbi:MAG TPA: hypothetical protein VFY23_04195 [Candidatus Limnocylindrales bacterium]|nr:hypothetical protein [Candidatus Limnocylindrales bacterium]